MTLPSSISHLPRRTAEFGALVMQWAAINSGSGNRIGLDRMRAALRQAFNHFSGAEFQEVPIAFCSTGTSTPSTKPMIHFNAASGSIAIG
jgi:hypothetical protein